MLSSLANIGLPALSLEMSMHVQPTPNSATMSPELDSSMSS
jgi:hypothetical protein